MKFLFYDMGSYIYKDFLEALEELGHTVRTIYYHFPNRYEDAFFCERFSHYLESDSYDAVISINFFPLIAKICYENRLNYISWSYDSPLDERLEAYFKYDTNYIFLFDGIEVAKYNTLGYNNVFHLPLAVNTNRLSRLRFSNSQIAKYSCDISFVGQLYDSPLDILLNSTSEYLKGYIEGIIQAQLKVYGYYMIDALITCEMLDIINTSLQSVNPQTDLLNMRGLSYAIATKITHLERYSLLANLALVGRTHFYTYKNENIPNVKHCGPIRYSTDMPCLFQHSKINLNPTLRCIQSGIPLRALDIMGCGGVLLSNYQIELAEHFNDGSSVIMYSSIEEAIDKVTYYLAHDHLLPAIAQNGFEKVAKNYHYSDRINVILKTINR